MSDAEVFISRVRALREQNPELSLSDAARRVRSTERELTVRVLDAVGSWPSSEPEIRALQGLS